MKDREWSGLMKIPNYVIIKELRTEIGKLKSEIDEFKYLNVGLNNANKELSNMLVRYKSDKEKLEAEVKRQQKANTNLLKSIIKLKKKYET
jgi:septal ring factor EnvC (AmiA/AmiB activator)